MTFCKELLGIILYILVKVRQIGQVFNYYLLFYQYNGNNSNIFLYKIVYLSYKI
jgi:hypothetical protein